MVSHRKLALILFCVLTHLVVAGCRKKKQTGLVEELLSKESGEIAEARDALLAAGKTKESTAQLINLIAEKKNRNEYIGGVEAAMFVLGEMRAVEAVDVLVDNIGFPYVYEGGKYSPLAVEGGMWHRGLKGIGKIYAAAQALIKIGEPCLEGIMNKLSVTEDMNERLACFGVLVDVKGETTGLSMVKDAIESETESKKKEGLQRSLELWLKIRQQMEGG